MAIGVDRVQVIKRESAALGGDAADDVDYYAPIRPQLDAIESCGVFLQDAGVRDELCYVARSTNDLILVDPNNPAGRTLSALGVGTPRDTIKFGISGRVVVVTSIDTFWVAPRACTIRRVTMIRGTAGTSGSTTVDVNKNAVTIYTTQANRPSVTQASGNLSKSTTTPDITAVAQNDVITVDVDVVEGSGASGPPVDLSVILELEYT